MLDHLSPFVIVLLGLLPIPIVAIVCLDPTESRWRTPVAFAAMASMVVYISWRWSTTDLAILSPGGRIVALFLLGIEALMFVDSMLFFLAMSRMRHRSADADRHEARLRATPVDDLPDIDVFIATYNEEWAILERTISAIKNMDYPKKAIFLCDDGKRDWLRDKCVEVGVGYIRRRGNAHKKPGNHNYALSVTKAPFIAVFDADFMPFENFLWRTIGLFDDPKVGIVQTPQCFYNFDPMRTNLRMQNVLPDDTQMFFNVMQPCRDAWGCAFYVGSSAVLRRQALADIGGVVMGYDTEDQITSIAMLQHGYRTAFLNEMLSIGLAPESLPALVEQRKRWARGSIQILFSKHGPFGPSLSLIQRLLFSQTFWVAGFICPLLYSLLPPIVWLFQPQAFPDAPADEILFIPILYFSVINLCVLWLSRWLWFPIVSSAQQLLLSVELLPTVLTTFLKPFGDPLLKIIHVTPKGAAAATASRVRWGTLSFFVGIMLATLIGIAPFALGWRTLESHPFEIATSVFWTLINLVTVTVAGLCCIAPDYRRTDERFPLHWDVEVRRGGAMIPTGQTRDISLSGCSITCEHPPAMGDALSLRFPGIGDFEAAVVRSGDREFGVEFTAHTHETWKALFAALFLSKASHVRRLGGPIELYSATIQRILFTDTAKLVEKP